MLHGQIHRFMMQDTRLVLDINSGSLHQVDELTWDLLGFGSAGPNAEERARLEERYTTAAVLEARAELAALVQRGWLLSPPVPYEAFMPKPGDPVRAICLNVAHSCNLSCDYCFAEKGAYGGQDLLMSAETARRAVDLLIELSGARSMCEVDFFGGEPLLNWAVVQETIAYARRRGQEAGKDFTFTLTTNATLLTTSIMDELDREQVSVILSLDGRPDVHDAMRCGSSDAAEAGVRAFLERRAPGGLPAWEHGAAQGAGGRGAYAVVRGTFTSANLDFAQDAAYIADSVGAPHFSLEPVIARPEEPYALREEHLPRLLAEYEALAVDMARRKQEGGNYLFHHFAVDDTAGPCLPRRVQGCGAGIQYLAVTPEGDLYPCHQFVGRDSFRLGNVDTGITRHDLQETLAGSHVFTKQGCAQCWARFHCSGGCYANAELISGDINLPDRVGCELTKKRLECALWLKAVGA